MFVYILISIINLLYWALFILFIVRMILSFVHIDPYDPTWGFIPRKVTPLVFQLTEPILRPVRNILPPQGGIDLSPMIVLIGFWLLRSVIFGILF